MNLDKTCKTCYGQGEIKVYIAGSYHGTRPHLDGIWKCPECNGKGEK